MQWIPVDSRPGAMDKIHGQSMHVTSQASGALQRWWENRHGLSLGPERGHCNFLRLRMFLVSMGTASCKQWENMGKYGGVLSIILSSRHETLGSDLARIRQVVCNSGKKSIHPSYIQLYHVISSYIQLE